MNTQEEKKLIFVKREMEPMMLEVAGNSYPAIFNYRAITTFEDENEGASMEVFVALLDSVYDDHGNVRKDELGNPVPSLPTRLILSALKCMMNAAGVGVEEEELFSSVCFGELPVIIAQLKAVIAQQRYKKEKGERNQKNGKTTAIKK